MHRLSKAVGWIGRGATQAGFRNSITIALVCIGFGVLVSQSATAEVLGPATMSGVRSTMESAQRRTALDALARRHGGNAGGCAPLPRGWTALTVNVRFPREYNGYPAWVNSAELVPAAADVQGYVNGGPQPQGAFVRPALAAGPMAVTSSLCAPAGRRYWFLVDSGRARVLIGAITVGAAPGPYQLNLTAPPLQHR